MHTEKLGISHYWVLLSVSVVSDAQEIKDRLIIREQCQVSHCLLVVDRCLRKRISFTLSLWTISQVSVEVRDEEKLLKTETDLTLGVIRIFSSFFPSFSFLVSILFRSSTDAMNANLATEGNYFHFLRTFCWSVRYPYG